MDMHAFYVIGIYTKTTNENGQSGEDIPLLWEKFLNEGILEKIPNKLDSTIYSVYTDYEGDFTKPYITVLGCKVTNLNTIPDGMIGITVPEGSYRKFVAKGKGEVFSEWQKIWNMPLKRKYTADFEVYGEKAQNHSDAEVDILIAVE